MKQNKIEVIVSGVFLLLISLPLVTMIICNKQFCSIDENRVMSSFPKGRAIEAITGDGKYFKEIENWFNDRFGFRDMLIRTKNQINYSVFNTTNEDGLFFGKDGYLSYKSVVAKEQVLNERMTEEELDNIVSALENLDKILQENNIEFRFVIPPQKNEVFPERVQEFPVNRPIPNNYEILCSKFKKNEGLNESFYDAMPVLREAEKNYPTYYKTDFHWNSYGATVVYGEIVNLIAQKEGIEEGVFDETHYVVEWIDGFKGGQLQNLPLWQEWEETTVITKKKSESKMREVTNDAELNEAHHWINDGDNVPLGTILFIGDSYTQYMLMADSGIIDCFKEVYWVHTDVSSGVLDNYLNKVDYIVFEKIESGMQQLEEIVNSL